MRYCKQHANWHISLSSDPYVKVWLMHKDKRVEKKKTVVMKRCLNPVFNESFPFDVPAHVLRETTIIITVMDKDRLSRNDVIGKVSPSLFFGYVLLVLLLTDHQQLITEPVSTDPCWNTHINLLHCKWIDMQQMRRIPKHTECCCYLDVHPWPISMACRQMQVHALIYSHPLKRAFSIFIHAKCRSVPNFPQR